jgi:hypothetical protein
LPGEKKEKSTRTEDGVWLTLLPVFETDEFGDDMVELFRIHLVNNTATGMHFEYRIRYAGKDGFELGNDLHAFQDFYIHDIPFENLNDNPAISIEFDLLTPDKNKAAYYEANLKLRGRQVFSRTEEMKKKGEATMPFKLFDRYPDKTVEEKPEPGILATEGYKIYDAAKARQHLEPAKYEIDLHIEKLADNWRGMDNFEMLTLQLRIFEKYFDLAVAHHQASLVVIHGVGSGKLRDEIHEILKLKHEVKFFVNQYDARYGYGATEIFFQYVR